MDGGGGNDLTCIWSWWSQNHLAYAFGATFAVGAVYLAWQLNRSGKLSSSQQKRLVFPIYSQFLIAFIVVFVVRAIAIAFLSRTSWLYGVGSMGVMTGLQAGVRDGLVVFFMQKSAGLDAIRRAVLFAVLWALLIGGVGIDFFFDPIRTNTKVKYLNVSVFYFVAYDGLSFLFYLVALVVVAVRRLKRYGRAHYIYIAFNLLAYTGFLVGDFLAIQGVASYGCVPLIVQSTYYALYAPLVYWTLLQDSNYWRGVMAQFGGSDHGSERSGDAESSDDPAASSSRGGTPGNSINGKEERSPLVSSGLIRHALDSADGAEEDTSDLKIPVIDFSSYSIGKMVGQGGSAAVFTGWMDGKQIAVKRFTFDVLMSEQVRSFARETKLAASLRHPNIVAILGVSIMLPYVALIMEFAARGSLFHLLASNTQLPTARLLRMARDCAAAVAYLHAQTPRPVVHLDLKSLNFLVMEDFTVKLSDFGESRLVRRDSHLQTTSVMRSTINWMAPETIQRRHFSVESDVYALGMVFVELVNRTPPFAELESWEIAPKVLRGERPALAPTCPHPLMQLIKMCWTDKPRDRPRADDIVAAIDAMISQEPIN